MNIQAFSMIEAAYFNPSAYGDLSGINLAVWIGSHLLADQKFMSIFSLLFGAGIFLAAERAESVGCSAVWLHFRRMWWLLLIGLAHAYLVWHGDILVTYALCAAIVFFFRRVRPGWLTFWAVLALSVPSLLFTILGLTIPFWPAGAVEDIRPDWSPSPEQTASQSAILGGNWAEQLPHRIRTALEFQTVVLLAWGAWRVSGLMLLGMAFAKWGVLTGQRSNRFYGALFIIGCACGFPLTAYGITRNFEANWSIEYSLFFGLQFNYWGSLLVATGYVGAFT